jgi:hypothetical protein
VPLTPTVPSLEELRDEFVRSDVRGWIWPWLSQILTRYAAERLCGRFNPRLYSPSGAWDTAGQSDLVNGFIIERGITGGAIAKSLAAAPDVDGAVRYLQEAFKRYVVSDRPRSLSRNIFDRLRDVLDQAPDFVRLAGVAPHSYYGLANWDDDPPSAASEDLLRDAARYLPEDIAWVNYSTGTRQSPGISSVDIERIVRALFDGLGRLLSAKQIMTVLEQRYPLRDELAEATSDPLSAVAARSLDPLEIIEAEELAAKVLALLNARQRVIVALMIEDPSAISARNIGMRLGISKSTAANELKAIQARFRLLGASDDAVQRQLLDALGPKLMAS